MQYAERVWHLTPAKDGDDDQRINTAIQNTQTFFEQMGVKTRLGDYGIKAESIPAIIAALELHKMVNLGEKRDVSLAVSEQVLTLSL